MLLTLKKSPISELTVPAKLQAYMASGKIILGAINGEAKSIINKNNIGIACESGDFNSLSGNAIFLKNLTTPQKIQMEENSKSLYFKEFSKIGLLNKLEDMFLTNNLIE